MMDFLFLFGLGIAGLTILFLSRRYARSGLAMLLWGIVAAVLFILQCLLLRWLVNVGSAFSGERHGYSMLIGSVLVFTISGVVYFFAVLAKFIDRK